ncbi:branched-chain amino acid ABC transporter permease [Microbacteriaceae bacterium K1510]|nr:branched-chain amino acid ABC transporter permease [Microbacteriaceae bacterium K1510]
MKLRIALYVLLAVVAVLLPLVAPPIVNNMILRVGSLVMLAISWNLAANAGLISLGHSAFWGLGSYAALLVANKLGWPFFASLVPAMIIGAASAAAIAVITGRLKGIFFAIAMLALSEGLRVIAVMTPDFTGGGAGVFIDQALRPTTQTVAMVTAFCAVACAAIAYLISLTPFHYACRAMRNNESVSEMLGINPLRFRIAVLSLSGAMASLAGGVNIWYSGFLDPMIGFDLHVTILAQIAPILGGIHTLAGPIIGAFATIGLSELTRVLLGEQGVSLLVYGLILVFSILYMPKGIVGTWNSWVEYRSRGASRAKVGATKAAPL